MVRRRVRVAARREEKAPGPTGERLRRAGEDFDRGQTGQVTLRDSPLERARRRDVITSQQFNAGVKFRHHWYHAGLAENIGSIDLNRIFARDLTGYSGMAKTEAQVFHRQRYREACRMLGLKREYVLSWAICREEPLEKIGAALGWNNRSQAIAAATELLRDGLDALALLWGVDS
jgi:uncharacterized protein DUF6456